MSSFGRWTSRGNKRGGGAWGMASWETPSQCAPVKLNGRAISTWTGREGGISSRESPPGRWRTNEPWLECSGGVCIIMRAPRREYCAVYLAGLAFILLHSAIFFIYFILFFIYFYIIMRVAGRECVSPLATYGYAVNPHFQI